MKIEQRIDLYTNQINTQKDRLNLAQTNNKSPGKEQGDSIDLSTEFINKALEYQRTQESPLGDTPPIEPSDPDDPSDG